MWQALQTELANSGFQVLAVALDRSPDDVRPFAEAAAATYPILVDSEHVVADLYRIINVPTGLWIDERGRIVRPNDAVFGNDTFAHMTGVTSGPHLDALRAWVKTGTLPFGSGAGVRARRCCRRRTGSARAPVHLRGSSIVRAGPGAERPPPRR